MVVVQNFSASVLSHPAGLAVHNGTLFVNEQKQGKILQFDVATGAYVGAIVSSVPDDLEALVLSDC